MADQQKALAWKEFQAGKCPSCGTFPDDWIDPQTKEAVEPWPYEVHSIRCLGCVTLTDEQQEAGPEGKKPGVFWYLTPTKPEPEE